ncbi:alanine racemase [Gilvibacter sp.]|uniref:alanine racemase n=1 Tax=Gilvibacter sp. TaxID=2729997 RepID=UPI003F49C753
MSSVSETVLELDLGALHHNYQFLRSKLKPDCKMLAVVKANGYGGDATTVALELQELGVDYLAVAYVNEGLFLRDAGVTLPILVLHPQPVNFELMVAKCLEPSIYSERLLEAFSTFASEQKLVAYPVHLKVNTGLNRLGFAPQQAITAAELVNKSESLSLRSAFTHLAASEDAAERDFTLSQLAAFDEVLPKLRALGDQKFFAHATNTSGILNYPQAHYDLVRTGIGLYGYANAPELDRELKAVMRLKTVISQIHSLQPGDSIGYNRGYVVTSPMKMATLPIGHADGLPRALGKGVGVVIINGKQAPIVGNVCMDMIMVDVSQIDCQEGDEVEVFGSTQSAEDLAKKANTISYELLTAVGGRIKRVVLR